MMTTCTWIPETETIVGKDNHWDFEEALISKCVYILVNLPILIYRVSVSENSDGEILF